MNNTTIQKTPEQSNITFEDVIRLKREKKDEIRQCKQRMMAITHAVFSPSPKTGKVDGLMNHISTGIAIYDGVMTGIKIMRKARKVFGSHRRW